MPRKHLACLLACAGHGLSLSLVSPAVAAEAVLPDVEVVTTPAPLSAPDESRGFTSATTSAEGIATYGGPAQTNPYRAIDLMPSVNLSGNDAYGLTVDQNFIRIRGVSAYTYSNLAQTVNGIPGPVNVGNGGMGNLWDLENVDAISLTRGAVAADQGLGFGDLAGAMDLRLKEPAKTFSGNVRFAYGTENFHKEYARVDSGELASGTRFFLSGSDAGNDKWRGSGDQERKNMAFGIAQTLGDRGKVELYAVHNEFSRNEYRPLTYAQASNLGTNYRLDYNSALTGNAAKDALYYKYNRQHFNEDSVLAHFEWRFTEDTTFHFKPYWSKTDGYRLTNSGSNIVRMDIEQEQKGVVAEVQTRWWGQSLTAGWWTQRIETIPPPLSQKVYTINSAGNLVFNKWAILAEMGEREYESPYVKLAGGQGNFKYNAGVRYLHFTLPGITSHVGTGIGDIDLDAALDKNPAVNSALTTRSTSFNAILPSLALQYDFTPGLEGRISAGRTVGNPWVGPLYSTYMSKLSAFQAAGISLQKLWDSLRLEKADTVDVGMTWRNGALSLAPTLYYTRFQDKQVTAYDPTVGVSYLQNGVKAHAYGAELEANWAVNGRLSLVGSVSWNVNKLDDNIRSGSGSTIASSGKQVPDTPHWLAKLGLNYQQGPWSVSPMIRYVGTRYGDALNTEKVASYTVTDIHAGYRFGPQWGFKSVELGASLLNLFDRHYISTINVGQDDARPGETTYYTGAPRTAVVSLNGSF